MRPRPRLYTASRLAKASQWIKLREEWKEIEFTAQWLDMVHEEEDATPSQRMLHWLTDFNDITRSDFLAFHSEDGEVQRGALIETGAALALGKPVFLIDTGHAYGSWRYHPLVRTVQNLSALRREISGC